jgi:hypothetical protein
VAAVDPAATADLGLQADALRVVGAARAALGAGEDAIFALDRAVDTARRGRSALAEARAMCARAELYAALGFADRARDDATAALAIFQRAGADPGRVSAERVLDRVARDSIEIREQTTENREQNSAH